MKPKTAIILCAVLVLCVVFMLARHAGLFQWDKADEEMGETIFDPAPSKPVKLTITDRKGGALRFARTDEDWQIIQPIKAKAESRHVNEVADAVRLLSGEQIEGLDNDITGLDSPLYVVKIEDDRGAQFTLHIGKQAPRLASARTRTYVRVPGGRAYVVAVDFADKLGRPVQDFRDKAIWNIPNHKVIRVGVTGKENYELLRRGDDWDFVSPFAARAISSKVDSLVRRACRLTAGEIVDAPTVDLGMFGLEEGKESAVIRLTLEAEKLPATAAATKPGKRHGKSYAIAFGRKSKDTVYARRLDKDDVYVLDASILKELQPKVIDLRVRQLIDVEPDKVTAIRLEGPGGPASLQKVNGRWNMLDPFTGRASDSAVGDLIEKMKSLKAQSFRDGVTALGAYGLAPPTAVIAMTLANQTQRPTLLIGRKSPSGDMTYVKSASDAAVAVVPTKDLKDIPANLAAYWHTSLLKLPENAKVIRLVMKRPDGTFTVRRQENDKWPMLAPIRAAGDADNIKTIIDRLENVSATQIVFLGKEMPRKYLRAKEAIVVTAVTASTPATTGPAGKTVTRTYVLNVMKIEDDIFAMQAAREVVAIGKCSRGLYEDLLAELRDRTVWKIDPKKITGVKILAGKETFEVLREGETWKYPADPYVKIDQSKVDSFLDDLEEARAEKFVSYKTKHLSRYRLHKPWFTVELTGPGGTALRVVVSHIGPKETESRYATADATEGIFVISAGLAARMAKKLEDFKKE